jgi:hypothetical protein
MASEVAVGITIGATLTAGVLGALKNVGGTLKQLGSVSDELRHSQNRLGKAVEWATKRNSKHLTRLTKEYKAVGKAIEHTTHLSDVLNASLARSTQLSEKRKALGINVLAAYMTAKHVAAPLLNTAVVAGTFKEQIQDVAIRGNFSRNDEAALGSTVRAAARQWGQTQADMAAGLGVLVNGGIKNMAALERYTPVLGKAATATRVSMDAIGNAALVLDKDLRIGADGFEDALNTMLHISKIKGGQFSFENMVTQLPQLTSAWGDLGVTGKEAVAEIGAALQIARRGASSDEEAAAGLKSFMAQITSKATAAAFAGVGVDIEESMKKHAKAGLTPLESMMEIVSAYLGEKGPKAAAEFTQAMEIKDDAEREIALQRLDEAYRLGELFRDKSAMNFLRTAVQNKKDFAAIKQDAITNKQNLLDEDYKRRMEGFLPKLNLFKSLLGDVALTVGEAIVPTLTSALEFIQPFVKGLGEFIAEHPGVVKAIVGLAAGVAGLSLAVHGAVWLLHFFIGSPLNKLGIVATVIRAKWFMFKPMFQLLGVGVLRLGRLLGGTLWRGLTLVTRAVIFLGRALFMNPIGLLITGIAAAAFLIYLYWKPIKSFFAGLWQQVKAAFSGGIGGIARLLINWSPMGLFYKAFQSVLSWFGVGLPEKFTDFGANLIEGLVSGIKERISAAKDAIVGFGKDIKGWFTSTLGINSPSKVFAGFGDNIAQGTAIGIDRSASLASRASAGMAADTAAAAAAQRIGAARAGGVTGGAGGMNVTFAPTINVPGGGGVQEQVSSALKLSLHELEQMMRRVMAQQVRRAY